MRKFAALITLIALAISPGIYANDGIGQVQSINELTGDWKFIVGQNDSFMLSKDGRFSISAVSGKLSITDLWKAEVISFETYKRVRDTYPVDLIAQKVGISPLTLGTGIDPKFSVVLMIGDNYSQKFFKENFEKLKTAGSKIYVVPGKTVSDFHNYYCVPDEWKLKILSGSDLRRGTDGCNLAKANHFATQNLTLVKMLKIERTPFAINNKTEIGMIVDTAIFEGLMK